jgi:hypothetical protein
MRVIRRFLLSFSMQPCDEVPQSVEENQCNQKVEELLTEYFDDGVLPAHIQFPPPTDSQVDSISVFHPKSFPKPQLIDEDWIQNIRSYATVKPNHHHEEYFTLHKILSMFTWAKEILHNHSNQYNEELHNEFGSVINVEELQDQFHEDLRLAKTVSDSSIILLYSYIPCSNVHLFNRLKPPIPLMGS